MTTLEVAKSLQPSHQFHTRDLLAAQQGFVTPPHLVEILEPLSIGHTIGTCSNAASILTRAASYLERRNKRARKEAKVGTNIFIGHGRSKDWLELKDFVRERLRLPYDEFNRVPVAGVPTATRLAEMLDAAAIALLVMTGEDELADGDLQARMNVIHEAGLFQGRLGFTRAIVLLEEGCSEFSNINGLGQIRFPRGKISAAFEDIRLVLEREGLIQPS